VPRIARARRINLGGAGLRCASRAASERPRTGVTREIVLVQNFIEELKRVVPTK
jgi:hypothetical protein